MQGNKMVARPLQYPWSCSISVPHGDALVTVVTSNGQHEVAAIAGSVVEVAQRNGGTDWVSITRHASPGEAHTLQVDGVLLQVVYRAT